MVSIHPVLLEACYLEQYTNCLESKAIKAVNGLPNGELVYETTETPHQRRNNRSRAEL